MINTSSYNGKSDLNGIVADKLILLVGAGVSIAPPTKLPSGQQLTEYYLNSCIGEELAEILLKQWKSLNEVIYQENGFEISLVRLEFIIGCINDVDKEFDYFPFIAGFQQFVNVQPNANHFYLGELKDRGCEIITPNFDCAIEKTFGHFSTLEKYGIPVNEVSAGMIYHYHGIGTQYEQLGATISEIKKGIKREFGEQLKEWFEQDYSIICVGFSCSDYFDMTPFFETLPQNSYDGNAIFFQHGNIVEKEILSKVEKFFCGFSKRKVFFGNTTAFLNDLKCLAGGKGYVDNKRKAVEWKTEFEKIVEKDNRNRIFYLIKILNQSGIILPKEIFLESDCPKLISKFHNMSELLEYAMDLLHGIDVKEYIIDLEDRSKCIFSDIVDLCKKINYTSDNLKRIIEAFSEVTKSSGVRKDATQIEYEEFVKHIRNSAVQPENFVTVYVYAFNRLSKKAIRNVLQKGVVLTKDIQIHELYECAEKMLKLPFYEYEYISYYLSIIKVHNILSIMLGIEKDIELCENYMVNLALEICGLSLVIKIYFNTVLQYIMLFAIKKELEYYQKAKKKMEVAKKCIYIIHNHEMDAVWTKKNDILKRIENIYYRYNQIDYDALIQLIL